MRACVDTFKTVHFRPFFEKEQTSGVISHIIGTQQHSPSWILEEGSVAQFVG